MFSTQIMDKTNENKRTHMRFSIDEILKPSFGTKIGQSQTSDNVQPLDMRKDREEVSHYASEIKTSSKEETYGASPTPSSVNDDHSNSSLHSSRVGSPVTNYSSNSRGSTSSQDSSAYGNELEEHLKSSLQSHNDFLQSKYPVFSLDQIHFITSASSYYNTPNQMYSMDIYSIDNHLYNFNQFDPRKHFMNPFFTYPNISPNQNHPSCISVLSEAEKSNDSIYNANVETRKSTKSLLPFNEVRNSHKKSNKCPNTKQYGNQNVPESKPKGETIFPGKGSLSEDTKTDDKDSKCENQKTSSDPSKKDSFMLPAWVYCTRYSDRPSSGPRYRKPRARSNSDSDKRPRTAFSNQQLHRLRREFETCPYLSETRRQSLATELGLNESQVKIWFQNKRAKLKKSSGSKNLLALRLMEEGLYNHSTIVVDEADTKSL